MKAKTKNFKRIGAGFAVLLLIVPLFWMAPLKLEGVAPVIRLERSSLSFGASQLVTGTVSDNKNNVHHVRITLIKDRREAVLFEKQFSGSGFFTFDRKGPITASFNFTFAPQKLGITDGPATLRMTARDTAWRGWGRGNLAYVEKDVVIDTQPPEITVLSQQHYFDQGGAGLVIYKLSEVCPNSAVVIGEKRYPGHSGYFADPSIFLAFLAVGIKTPPDADIFIEAVDPAANRHQVRFGCHVRKKKFKTDILRISDGFLRGKKDEFAKMTDGRGAQNPLELFLKINKMVRRDNMRTFSEIGAVTEPVLHWEGTFLRLPQAATKATFADYRSYQYRDRIVDHQIHMGVDLASTKNSIIPAANRGRVVYNGNLGIFGNTVVIDHGFGLHSVYAHLHRIDVQKGQMVGKGDTIGITGKTGLAGGDHLHFGMMVHGTFVNPLEWWDAAWVGNHITAKIEAVERVSKAAASN